MFAFILYGTWKYRWDHTVFDLIYAFLMFLLLYEGYAYLAQRFDLQIKHQKILISPQKVILAAVIFCLYSWFLLTFVAFVPFYFFMDGFVSPVDSAQEIRMNYVFNFAFALGYFSTLTGYNIFGQLKQAKLEAEKLERARTMAQMESLKNQISPHFLFNSLNALSTLIDKDEDTAVQFVDELAATFRYVTNRKDIELTTLKDELNFIKGYLFLLKIRFRNTLISQISIENEANDLLIPPLTLQLLVENAIKHNIVSKEDPLTIEIFTEKDTLVVRNNLQKRRQSEPSTGVGLENIINRYQYLSDRKVEIIPTDTYFIAKVPLLNSKV
ncbi:MAG: histidine kinase [Cryomorphaceae bacterium]|nr:histidine kinase [Cryomorphaceae bacterium]